MYTTPSIVVGYHGCDQSVADKVLKKNQPLSNSENAYDWLGHGQYFWEGSYSRALERAERKKKPAVIGAFIRLGNCLDLLDASNLENVKQTYQLLQAEYDLIGEVLPSNRVVRDGVSFLRDLDCKVIMRLQEENNQLIANQLIVSMSKKKVIQNDSRFIDSVRGMFPEGAELYDGAGFREKNHIQLCIVNPNCIVGYFCPIKTNKKFKDIG